MFDSQRRREAVLVALLETRTEDSALAWLRDHEYAKGNEREQREEVVLADGELVGV